MILSYLIMLLNMAKDSFLYFPYSIRKLDFEDTAGMSNFHWKDHSCLFWEWFLQSMISFGSKCSSPGSWVGDLVHNAIILEVELWKVIRSYKGFIGGLTYWRSHNLMISLKVMKTWKASLKRISYGMTWLCAALCSIAMEPPDHKMKAWNQNKPFLL